MPQDFGAPALVLLVGAVCVFVLLHVSHVQIASGCEPQGRAEREDDDELLEEKELLEEDELLEDEELDDDELDDELLEDELDDDERLDELEEDKLLDELKEERLDDDDGIISLPHPEGRAGRR